MKLVLKSGAYKGKSVTLNGVKYIDGQAQLKGNFQQNEGIINYQKKCYQAELATDDGKVIDGQRDFQANVASEGKGSSGGGDQSDGKGTSKEGSTDGDGSTGNSSGSEGSLPKGNGHENTGMDEKLKTALASLDHAKDEHWTDGGKPLIAAVEGFLGEGGVSRAAIEAAAPGLKRNKQ